MTLSEAKLLLVLAALLTGVGRLTAKLSTATTGAEAVQHLRSLLEDQPHSQLLEDRAALHQFLSRSSAGASEGILIPAGGQEQLTNCAAAVKLLREHFRSRLPIEVFYNGEHELWAPAKQLIEVISISKPRSIFCFLTRTKSFRGLQI